MSIDNIVQLDITSQSKAPTAAGFGTGLIAVYHERWTERVHEYGDQDELLDEGFTIDDAVYKIATIIKSQSPAPPTFKVGRRAIVHTTSLDPTGHIAPATILTAIIDGHTVTHTVASSGEGTQALVCAALVTAATAALVGYTVATNGTVVTITAPGGHLITTTGLVNLVATTDVTDPPRQTVSLLPQKLTAGIVYSGTIGGKAFTYTVGTSEAGVPASVCTAFAAVLSALGLAAVVTAGATDVQVKVNVPGTILDYAQSDTTRKTGALRLKDVTADATLTADLAAIRDEDDDWYCLWLDTNNASAITEAAAVIETTRKICVGQTADWDAKVNSQTGDILSTLKASSYARTGLIYHNQIGGSAWAAVGWGAGRLAVDPGKETWAFKGIAGVPVDVLKPGEETSIFNKNGSLYGLVRGLPLTQFGKTAGGNRFDTVRFIDWLYARMLERIIFTLANNPKIPYSDAGVDVLRGAILAVLQLGIDAGGLLDTPAPFVNAPLVSTIDPVTKLNRILPNVTFGAQGSNAIEGLKITGTVFI